MLDCPMAMLNNQMVSSNPPEFLVSIKYHKS